LRLLQNRVAFTRSFHRCSLWHLAVILLGLTVFYTPFTTSNFPAEAAQGEYYQVKAGDCLWLIARRNNVTVNELKRANGLKSDFLSLGKVLYIPVKNSAGRSYAAPSSSPPVKQYVPPSRSGDVVNDLVNYAATFLGTRYRWAGESPATGFDCSGFTKFIFGQFGVSLPHSAAAQNACGVPVLRGEIAPGDILLFHTLSPGIDHAAIYCGNGKFIHASSRAGCVRSNAISEDYWNTHFVAARRVLKSP
jgi:peptidoglycan endopeptidase LytE